MPKTSRVGGRFRSVLMAAAFALLATGSVIADGPTLCHISEGVFGKKSGANKKAAALSFVQTAIGATNAIAEKDIMDGNKFQDGLSKVIDGVVQCLNASVWAGNH